jgi:hypothetical protein
MCVNSFKFVLVRPLSVSYLYGSVLELIFFKKMFESFYEIMTHYLSHAIQSRIMLRTADPPTPIVVFVFQLVSLVVRYYPFSGALVILVYGI